MNVEIARRLRRDMTDAEKVMWRLLRSRQLGEYKFRRQEPIGRYIVDFVCFSPRLIIEIDGGQHATNVERDEIRSTFLRSEGFEILRLWNNDVLENAEGICARIVESPSTASPHPPGLWPGPSLSHKGERE